MAQPSSHGRPVLREGLGFKKLDLHVHTPASIGDFERGGVSEKRIGEIAQEICKSAASKDLDGIAITDHNSGAWIDRIKAANVQLNTRLAIIPGAEVDAYEGIHVICLFGNDAKTADIEDFLLSVGVNRDSMGRTDFAPDKRKASLDSIREEVTRRKGLLVAAHADSDDRALFAAKKNFATKRITSMMEAARFDAFETKNIKRFEKHCRKLVGNAAVYQASDNPNQGNGLEGSRSEKHHHSGIGLRYSWFKLDEISVEGLYQCFIDPDVRIRQMDDLSLQIDGNVPRILSLTVNANQGFFNDGQVLTFNDDINSILGGKGAGKSLVVEYIRFAVDQISEDPVILIDTVGKLVKTLGSGGTVSLQIRTREGEVFKAQRTFDIQKLSAQVTRKTKPKQLNENLCREILATSPIEVTGSEGEAHSVDVAALFPVRAYSQNEIFAVAASDQAQLALMDTYIDQVSFRGREHELVKELTDSDDSYRQSLEASWSLPALKRNHATIATKNKAKAKKYANPKYKESAEIDQSFDMIVETIDDILTLYSTDVDELADYDNQLEAELQKYRGRQRLVVKSRLTELRTIVTNASKSNRSIQRQLRTMRKKTIESADLFRENNKKFLEGAEESVSRTELQEERKAKKELDEAVTQANRLKHRRKARDEKLDELDVLRRAFSELRAKTLRELTDKSGGRLRLGLEERDNRDEFKELMKEALRGSGTQPERYLDRLLRKNTPRQLVDKITQGDIAGLKQDIGEKTHVDCKKIVQHLRKRLSTLLSQQYKSFYDDRPLIRLNVGNSKDGRPIYKQLSELSTGQKSTALLVLSLVEGDYPVLVDQPEDALDLKSVIDDVATRLRSFKSSRQFIITTHNSSVAVSSDSDKYFILEPQGDTGTLAFSGAIDNETVRKEIMTYLEGGPVSYELKRRKYRHQHL